LTIIQNRKVAGKKLAEKISEILNGEKPIVLAIPRGGVVVGEEIAKKLGCSLDIIISKKITPPSSPEYAIGAITHNGTIYQSQHWDRFSQEPKFEDELNKKKLEVKRRLEEYRGSADYKFDNKTVILVDDGIATGSTVFVLVKWLSERKVNRVILAVPVIPTNTFEEMKSFVDTIVALETPIEFYAVSQFYKEFDQVSDKEVMTILDKFKKPQTVDNGIS
jgi:putative phosphoribosyl transferase